MHAAPTPLLGGLAIYMAFSLAILANSILDRQVVAILLGATLLVVVGVLDDIVEVPAAVKLLAQLVAVGVVIGSGVILTLFPQFWLGPLIDVTLTVIWLLGITNAMNFFDGMDGLATGLSIITASFLGLFAVPDLSAVSRMVRRRPRGQLSGVSALQLPSQGSGGDLSG